MMRRRIHILRHGPHQTDIKTGGTVMITGQAGIGILGKRDLAAGEKVSVDAVRHGLAGQEDLRCGR
jgi:hypothetical protein